LSLGIATTLLVAATIVIVAMVRLLDSTVPQRAPALAFYDIQASEIARFEETVAVAPGVTDVQTVPLVLGRLISVNDEHKLSYRLSRVDNVRASSGKFWADDYVGPPQVAMEDREAGQIGVQVGDTLQFSVLGETLTAELVAIYAQGNFETRFWFEALFSPGVLDDYITRYVGVAFQDATQSLDSGESRSIDVLAANAIASDFPSVVTIRTARGLATAKRILNSAALAVAIVAVTSLIASLLVLASVVAANRQRQLREAAILHAIGSRHGSLMRSLGIEYLLLGCVVALFAGGGGGVLGSLVASAWLELPVSGVTWLSGAIVSVGVVLLCLGAGALWVSRSLSASPAQLLRAIA